MSVSIQATKSFQAQAKTYASAAHKNQETSKTTGPKGTTDVSNSPGIFSRIRSSLKGLSKAIVTTFQRSKSVAISASRPSTTHASSASTSHEVDRTSHTEHTEHAHHSKAEEALEHGETAASMADLAGDTIDNTFSFGMKLSEMSKPESGTVKHSGTEGKMGKIEEGVAQGAAALGILSATVSLATTLSSVKSDRSKWSSFNDKISSLKSDLHGQMSSISQTYSSRTFTIRGKSVDASKAFNMATSSKLTTSEQTQLIQSLKSQGVSNAHAEALQQLAKAHGKLANLETAASDFKVGVAGKYGQTTSEVTYAAVRAVHAFSKVAHAAMGQAIFGVGMVVGALKMPFDVHGLVRSTQSFRSSKPGNPTMTSLMNSNTITDAQKSKLEALQKNIHRLARKKLTRRILETTSSGLGIASGVAAFTVAGSPAALALSAGAAIVGLGASVLSKYQAHRHGKKLAVARSQVGQTQANAQHALKMLKAKLEGTSGTERAAMLQKYHLTESSFKEVDQVVHSKTMVAELTSDHKSVANAIHSLAADGASTMAKSLSQMTYSQFIERSGNGSYIDKQLSSKMATLQEKYTSSPRKLAKELGISRSSSPGEVRAALFNKAKAELTKQISDTAAKSGSEFYDKVADLHKRDEHTVDAMFQSLHNSFTNPADKAALLKYYGEISASSGKEAANMATLSGSSDYSQFSRFAELQ